MCLSVHRVIDLKGRLSRLGRGPESGSIVSEVHPTQVNLFAQFVEVSLIIIEQRSRAARARMNQIVVLLGERVELEWRRLRLK
jgi:hypothetical protein